MAKRDTDVSAVSMHDGRMKETGLVGDDCVYDSKTCFNLTVFE
jgi:hypothetical protein